MSRVRCTRTWFRGLAVWAMCGLGIGVALSGCSEEPPPVAAAKQFAAAVRSRDTEALLKTVDRKTLAYVELSAERASDQIGGRRSVSSSEMLQVVDVDGRFAVAKAELLSDSGDAASVKLIGADGGEHEVHLVFEDGAWKVSLPTPPLPAGAEKNEPPRIQP
ncbi:MAG: hypothetical protein KUG77_03030 [Nannocystaceae bacterium]|nr:hypothetical protein [Nannocystaceae bacterium]